LLEIKEDREQAADKDGKCIEDIQILEVSTFWGRIWGAKPIVDWSDRSPALYSNSCRVSM
jgi:hypothetical protein